MRPATWGVWRNSICAAVNIPPCLISIDKSTNELVAVRQEHVYIPQEVSGVKLTAEEIRLLKEGQPVKVEA